MRKIEYLLDIVSFFPFLRCNRFRSSVVKSELSEYNLDLGEEVQSELAESGFLIYCNFEVVRAAEDNAYLLVVQGKIGRTYFVYNLISDFYRYFIRSECLGQRCIKLFVQVCDCIPERINVHYCTGDHISLNDWLWEVQPREIFEFRSHFLRICTACKPGSGGSEYIPAMERRADLGPEIMRFDKMIYAETGIFAIFIDIAEYAVIRTNKKMLRRRHHDRFPVASDFRINNHKMNSLHREVVVDISQNERRLIDIIRRNIMSNVNYINFWYDSIDDGFHRCYVMTAYSEIADHRNNRILRQF
jgi:hypothetical protein